MDILTTATGKQIKVAGVTQDGFLNVIHIKVCEMTVPSIAIMFSDERETSTLTYGDRVYSGYTVIQAISPMSEWVNVMMGRIQ